LNKETGSTQNGI